ncbi:MAG: hypothetical protein PSX36_09260 [bacterium]|nr:hypothetical protein [bacterium]
MKANKLILLLLLMSYIGANAQVMNVRKWRKSEKDSLDNGMYFIEEENYLRALPIFDALVINHPSEEFLRYTYAKCALYRADKHEDAYSILTELYEKNKKVPEIQYDVALAALYNYKFDLATEYIDYYALNKHTTDVGKVNAVALKKNIGNARYFYNNPTPAKLTNVGTAINSPDEEYVPAITADESMMIFTYAGRNSIGGRQNEFMQPDMYGDFLEDIYQSRKENGEFKPAVAIDYLNTNLPDAAISISNDGRTLFIFQNLGDGHGDIYQSNLVGDVYSKPAKLKGEVNSYSWEGHCSLSPDGNLLYFSSDRPGGFGGRDLYRATLLPDSVWGNVLNLGDSINTPFDEDAPFIHADGRTLYFSSKGHNSMGGYDVFRTRMTLTDSAFKYSENLGYPINSPSDDIYFVLSADSKHGYYSSVRKDGVGLKDIYEVDAKFTEEPPTVILVKGILTDNNIPVEAQVHVHILSKDNKLYKGLNSNSTNGSYLVTLPPGEMYKVIYTYPGKEVKSLTIDATALSGYVEKINSFDFTIVPDTTQLATTTPTAPIAATTGSQAVATAGAVTAGATVGAAVVGTKTGALKDYSYLKDKDFPKTGLQEKTMRYAAMYGDITAEGLEFKVQVAAVTTSKTYNFPNMNKLGKLEKLMLGDGYTRLTVGGSFKTIGKALEHNKTVVKAGQGQGFVIALYKGQRVSYDYLEQIGVFK